MVVKRNNFRGCEIFTSERSLQSISDAISRCLDNKPESLNVLDAFCGDGIVGEHVSRYLESRNISHKLTFIDNNPDILESIKREGEKKCIDISTSWKIGEYDLIVARYGLHDLSIHEKKIAIQAMSQSLREDGKIIICDIMPSKKHRLELTSHHQYKEDLCSGPNKSVYLATAQEYIIALKNFGIHAEQSDYFLQEVYLKNWLGTLNVSERSVILHEKFTLNMSDELKENFQVYEHRSKGVKMYYPVGTIVGVKK